MHLDCLPAAASLDNTNSSVYCAVFKQQLLICRKNGPEKPRWSWREFMFHFLGKKEAVLAARGSISALENVQNNRATQHCSSVCTLHLLQRWDRGGITAWFLLLRWVLFLWANLSLVTAKRWETGGDFAKTIKCFNQADEFRITQHRRKRLHTSTEVFLNGVSVELNPVQQQHKLYILYADHTKHKLNIITFLKEDLPQDRLCFSEVCLINWTLSVHIQNYFKYFTKKR